MKNLEATKFLYTYEDEIAHIEEMAESQLGGAGPVVESDWGESVKVEGIVVSEEELLLRVS